MKRRAVLKRLGATGLVAAAVATGGASASTDQQEALHVTFNEMPGDLSEVDITSCCPWYDCHAGCMCCFDPP